MNTELHTYLVHNISNTVHKEARDEEEAKKMAKQLGFVFGENFIIERDKDLWSLNYYM